MKKQQTFAGIDEQYAQFENASIAVLPVSYDGTSTWIKGADKGPKALLEAAENMELYDIETNSEVYRNGIFLCEPLKHFDSPELMVDAVRTEIQTLLKQEKFVVLIGGEHSVSIGAIQAHREKYNDLTVLQLDAHADLRPEYDGSTCNHACALYESSQLDRLIQVGIRSMDKSELPFVPLNRCHYAHDLVRQTDWPTRVVEQCGDKVYLTIDLDVFDPSIMPSTGTPEPGGLGWYEVLDLIKLLIREKQLIGFDIVELCPNKWNKAPNFLAAKLLYKLLSYRFA